MDENDLRAKLRIERRKRKRKMELIRNMFLCSGGTVLLLILIILISGKIESHATINDQKTQSQQEVLRRKYITEPPDYSVQLLPVNQYSRPGTPLTEVKGIVIHYVGNSGTTAQQNYSYFKGLAQSGTTSASSHFIVGLDGEIIQCVPCNEIAYASNDRNADTISIEVCHRDASGRFSDVTKESLIRLTTWLMGRYDLSIRDVIRHYDVTGKQCPKYYVENPAAWDALKDEMVDYIDKNGTEKDVGDLE